MPPRLPSVTALSGSLESLSIRTFSSTASLARPPREAPTSHPHHATHADAPSQQPSSTSSLLSLNRPVRRNSPAGGKEPGSAANAASRMLNRYKERANASLKAQQAHNDLLREQKLSSDYLREMPRRWNVGDVYSPHDLSPVEMQKWRRRAGRKGDIIDALGVSPLDMYKNFAVISEFTKSSGQIISARDSGLRPVNQRKMAKMVRRAQGMGIYPSIHKHPDMIRRDFYPHGMGR